MLSLWPIVSRSTDRLPGGELGGGRFKASLGAGSTTAIVRSAMFETAVIAIFLAIVLVASHHTTPAIETENMFTTTMTPAPTTTSEDG